jgi:uncharacterized protein YyaL (SSP411 family)
MPNRLIHEKSPYLLQHAHNPVDWYPWGAPAFEAAREANKPIFLSVGYATCHWCHVMEKESFEDPETAAALNHSFVCIKVDREERPDIDALYMAACQIVTGSGGWPLSIIMTADKRPFFAGTYLPKLSQPGRLGVMDLCHQIKRIYDNEPDRITQGADSIMNHLDSAFAYEAADLSQPDPELLGRAVADIARRFDPEYGGFDGAPKFPTPHRLLFLLNRPESEDAKGSLRMAVKTLEAMRMGGIWDHVGFGFHRYATDNHWLLPHFEKMLYDQAWLAAAYTRAFEITGLPLLGQTARDTLDYVLRDMTSSHGGFFTAEDADSEGEEGKFYLWSKGEFEDLIEVSGKRYPWTRIFNLSPEGNFLEEATRRRTGTNILHLTRSLGQWAEELGITEEALSHQWEVLRQALFIRREQRVHPLKDDKILTDWNGMMIAALAQAARVLNDDAYLRAAREALRFIQTHLKNHRGHLLHRYRKGQAAIEATANDYAAYIMGLIELHLTTGEKSLLEQATGFQVIMDNDFWDRSRGGYFLSLDWGPDEFNALPVRPKELYDGAMPSANSIALNNLIRLGALTGNRQWKNRAREQMQAFAGSVRAQPTAFTHMLDGWQAEIGAADQDPS